VGLSWDGRAGDGAFVDRSTINTFERERGGGGRFRLFLFQLQINKQTYGSQMSTYDKLTNPVVNLVPLTSVVVLIHSLGNGRKLKER
jgi:hypothetical protein